MVEKVMVLWLEVIRKWKVGILVVDERFIVVMVCMYLFQQEWNVKFEDSKILDLFQEMMGVFNYVKFLDWNKQEVKWCEVEFFDEEVGCKKIFKVVVIFRNCSN